MPSNNAQETFSSASFTNLILYALFFLSGCSALIYQIIWQRMLFTVFGVDLISTTIIISVFMFGLGMGGLLGGRMADSFTHHLRLYIIIELLIAVFGFVSPFMMDAVANLMYFSSPFYTALTTFLILAFPTMLMGATFPILVTHINLSQANIGESVGRLYFANTLGGAAGAYFAGFILLHVLAMDAVIYRAALLNLIIAFVAFLIFRRR